MAGELLGPLAYVIVGLSSIGSASGYLNPLGDATTVSFRYFDGIRESRTPRSKGSIDKRFDFEITINCTISCNGEMLTLPKILRNVRQSDRKCSDLIHARFSFIEPSGLKRLWYVDETGTCLTDGQTTLRTRKDLIYQLRKTAPSKW